MKTAGRLQLYRPVFQAIFIATFGIGIIVPLPGCGKPELSRTDAAKHISNSAEMASFKKNIPLQSDALGKGVNQGLWRIQQEGYQYRLYLGEKAARSITGLSNTRLTLNVPAIISVEVTGIASATNENSREVQFTWHYENLPGVVKRFVLAGGNGIAHFRLFDDGWRMDNAKIDVSNTPPFMSPQEQAEEAADIQLVTEQRAREEEAQRQAAQALAKRIRESKTATRIIETISFPQGFPSHLSDRQEIKISDVDIEFRDNYGPKYKVWFGHIQNVNVSPGNEYATISFTKRMDEYGYNSHMLIPVGNDKNGEILNRVFSQALEAWRKRYNDLPTD